jgi:hypothetical protein
MMGIHRSSTAAPYIPNWGLCLTRTEPTTGPTSAIEPGTDVPLCLTAAANVAVANNRKAVPTVRPEIS